MTDQKSQLWRVPEELADPERFQEALHDEFTPEAWRGMTVTDRRQFLKLMGASAALAGLQGCVRQPNEEIVAFANTPEHMVPGTPQMYATAIRRNGFGLGVLVQSHDGRPTKIEGNPQHPASLGATDAITQAAILELYDPDRSQVIRRGSQISTWDKFTTVLRAQLPGLTESGGRGLRVLTGPVTSPTLISQLQQLREQYPEAHWHVQDTLPTAQAAAAQRQVFGQDVAVIHRLENADVICSLDADFLHDGPQCVRLTKEFAKRRRVSTDQLAMSRMYAVDCSRNLTAASADHRLAVAPADLPALLEVLAERLGVELGDQRQPAADLTPRMSEFLELLVADLQNAAPGRSVLVAGEAQPQEVHALTQAINQQLGNLGQTVVVTDPVVAAGDSGPETFESLVQAMRQGEVELLLMLGVNPVYTAAGLTDFADALGKVPISVHHGLYDDETAAVSTWHVPAVHDLESWSDVRAFDGTTTILQPLIAPLYNGRSEHELLSILGEGFGRTPYEMVRSYWKRQLSGDSASGEQNDQNGQSQDFERWWQQALHDGLIDPTDEIGGAAAEAAVTVAAAADRQLAAEVVSGEGLQLVFRPDPHLLDGRYANNAWLQELPKPFTKLTWGNAALVGPGLAKSLHLEDGHVIAIERDGRTVQIPAWVVPGHPAQSITLHLGAARTAAGRVGNGVGVDVSVLRSAASPWQVSGASVTVTEERQNLPCTQRHHLMQGRELVKAGTLTQLSQDPQHPPFMESGHHGSTDATFYPEWQYDGYKWGMSINLSACTGCNACVVACQSENNIPVVGPDQVLAGREMHWLRIDTYYSGEQEDPEAYQQPVPCMHCEHAPCEPVCPVGATTHSSEGLNEMTYNRCIGTRYCSNNCPYKVRRFNFYDYNEEAQEQPVLQLLENPNVTVRSRGVMEKCTYCVQRISAGRINAETQDRRINDGEVVTACQAVCPANAIVFGDMNDPQSSVVEAKNSPLDYALLEELNTRPRTTYQAVVRNPHQAADSTESTAAVHRSQTGEIG